ncbi:mannonate dehydratase [Opitutus terrae]|uniref:mannonate dehydratase n=1 Tax=Opitutus terrae (strain DSM 11246 / JCM 15787 / PB90-1) TaxID=452637 RepID=B1ZRG4_OPITP|nr:mannonate dehydratase [Opitutus terrae]ACB77614.1 Mannonate dehydratase [Opitutus terrae PB90-1]
MKLGLGLYRHMLTRENFLFARQAGATHIVAHLVDYFRGGATKSRDDQPTGTDRGWGLAGDPAKLWTLEELVALRRDVEAAGLKLEAIENFDPAHWHDVLLDGPRRAEHIENVKTILRRLGEAGIPIMGYNFSIAGVAGRTTGPYARGGAPSVGMEGPYDLPMPNGMVWNMIYDENAPQGTLASITHEELWRRCRAFLDEVLPVAEEAGVKLAAHPDDPPMPTVRGQPRLVYQPQLYQKLLDLNPSPANTLEFCIGSLAEMAEGDIYEIVDIYSRTGRLGYVHFRNITGKVPTYKETFIDDGDVDMLRVLEILRRNGFDGVLIPDHTPAMSCAAPWHAGMAFAMGYMKGAMRALGIS